MQTPHLCSLGANGNRNELALQLCDWLRIQSQKISDMLRRWSQPVQTNRNEATVPVIFNIYINIYVIFIYFRSEHHI